MQRELDSLVYRNPEGEWETADRYLSGDVRAKLKTAEAAAALDPSYQPQRRGAEGSSARRSPARRHQRPPRLLLDSGERRQDIRR